MDVRVPFLMLCNSIKFFPTTSFTLQNITFPLEISLAGLLPAAARRNSERKDIRIAGRLGRNIETVI